ncbi:hypothetical protein SpCBS45565_g02894 [Spizellomyces sp. 'palustris']|nr:hypothetical protein SpCBS45565_g02894 [Spizellomyces sp. 'palustris']
MPLLAFGSNAHGQLGTGATDDASVPVTCLVPNSLTTPPLCLAGGANHSVIVTADGSLLAAGANERGQLGIPGGRELHTFSPVLIPTVFPPPVFRYVACGWDHTLALTSDGDLYVFGSNEFGQLGLGADTKQVDRPLRLDIGTAVEKIAAGMRHSLISTRDQQVWGWGANNYGELGEISKPETINGRGRFPRKRAPPVYYPARLNVPPCSDIACGQHHSVLLTRDGRLLGLGRNRHAHFSADGALQVSDAALDGFSYGDATTTTSSQRQMVKYCREGAKLSKIRPMLRVDLNMALQSIRKDVVWCGVGMNTAIAEWAARQTSENPLLS